MADPNTQGAAEALATVAQAVTGPTTPEAATVTTAPPKWPTWALVLAGPAISVMLCGCVAIMAWVFWPGAMALKSEGLGEKIVLGVSTIATSLAVILGLVVFRLASGGLKSVRASAGPGSLEINTGDSQG